MTSQLADLVLTVKREWTALSPVSVRIVKVEHVKYDAERGADEVERQRDPEDNRFPWLLVQIAHQRHANQNACNR